MIEKNNLVIFLFLLISSVNYAFASNKSDIEFFVSNNTKEINIKTAYARLTGKEQKDLQYSILKIFQKNNLDPGKFENILGTYRMAWDNNITADNTECFYLPRSQHLENKKIFSIAQQLAKMLNQESVAVFVPNQSTISDVTVSFKTHQLNIYKTISLIHEKLPGFYSLAFSLHIANNNIEFKNVKVTKIEWLGHKINIAEIKKAFPADKISYHYGTTFLIYQNGQKQIL